MTSNIQFIILLVSILIFGSASLSAQSLSGKISYHLHSEQNNISLSCNLFFTPEQSVFIIPTGELEKNESKQQSNNSTTLNEDGTTNTQIQIEVADGNDLSIYKNFEVNEMISREIIFDGRKAIVRDDIPNVAWNITSEEKIIGSMKCYKATTEFRCAHYIAWFTLDIPMSVGPWKLGGLPGAILSLENASAGISYNMTKIEIPAKQDVSSIIAPPSNMTDKKYTFNEFAKVQRKEIAKIKAFLISKAENDPSGTFQMNLPECYE